MRDSKKKLRTAHSIFCDDIRQEIGGKYSLIGCYNAELILQAVLPAALPKLCCAIRLVTPIDCPFVGVVFRAFAGDKLLAESNAMSLSSKDVPKTDGGEAAKHLVLSAHMTFSPLLIEDSHVLRIEAETEDESFECGRLMIVARSTHDANIEVATVD